MSAAVTAAAAQTLYGQCGGASWTGATSCVTGAVCSTYNDYYAQCVSGAATATGAAGGAGTTRVASSVVVSITPTATASDDGCDAEPEETGTVTASSAAPEETDSECSAEPEETETAIVTMVRSSVLASATKVPTTMQTSTKVASSTGSGSRTSSAASSTSTASGQTKFAGVNIAGFDFGCGTDGTCVLSSVDGPITSSANGTAQMQHFASADNFNIFRLPVGWQFLVGGVLGGDLNTTNIASYDSLVQDCLSLGAYCMIDIHNYARWDGAIIGQSTDGPTDDQFVSLWTQLATKYASEERVWFGTMNEPHEVDIATWAATVQKVVTGIRNAGATSQYISLPGNSYTAASTFVSGGSAAALANVTNPDGTTDGLIFEVHKYLDSDNSGTSTECVTNNIDDAFSPLADYLRTNNRMAILAETGGGNTDSCEKYLCEEVAYLNENADVYLGYLGWSAGAFATSYALSETPTGDEDTSLVKACLAR